MEARFNSIVSELAALGRTYLVNEMNVKILECMPREDCFMKVTALIERDLSTKDVFASLRAHKFDLSWMNEHEARKTTQQPSKLEDVALFVKKKFLPRKQQKPLLTALELNCREVVKLKQEESN